ncbi:MAG: hypothetical protein ACRDX9_05055 [Acidimicrobiia bacterium]
MTTKMTLRISPARICSAPAPAGGIDGLGSWTVGACPAELA